jgi:hypothetical protein
LTFAYGGTGAGQGGGVAKVGGNYVQYANKPPTNYGAGASAGNWVSTGTERFTRGVQGVVIVRYQYK